MACLSLLLIVWFILSAPHAAHGTVLPHIQVVNNDPYPTNLNTLFRVGTTDVRVNNTVYLFGGLTISRTDIFAYSNRLVKLDLEQLSNGTTLGHLTTLSNENRTSLVPQPRAYANIELEYPYLYLKGGSNKVRNFKFNPEVQIWRESVELMYPMYCIFKDLWRYHMETGEWLRIYQTDAEMVAQGQRRLFCELAGFAMKGACLSRWMWLVVLLTMLAMI